LQSLEFIYQRDPGRRDVYVEGTYDGALINWFVRESGLHGVAVYPIESIEVPDGEILASGRKANNRERVAFLASFLAKSQVQKVACIVDADFARLWGSEPPLAPLFETDYASMEMYAFSEACLGKCVSLCCRRATGPFRLSWAPSLKYSRNCFCFAPLTKNWDGAWIGWTSIPAWM